MKSLASHLFALCLSALLPLAAAAQTAPVEGVDYERIDGGRPWQAEPGTIEVVEVFAYTCGHCDQFQPLLAAWKRKAGKDVRLRPLPAAYDPGDALARGFFAAEAMGRLGQVHQALFDAIHPEHVAPAMEALLAQTVNTDSGSGHEAGVRQVAALLRGRLDYVCMNLSTGRATRMPPEFAAAYRPTAPG